MSTSEEDSSGPALTTPDAWHTYLAEYGRLYIDNLDDDSFEQLDDQQETGWFGRQPADERAVAAVEERLGHSLPPSLRAFLLTTDGWTAVKGWVDEIFGCADLRWFRDEHRGAYLISLYEDDPDGEDMAKLFARSLLIAAGEDVWLLDPAEVDADGEWAAAEYQPKYGDLNLYPRFSALMADSMAD